MYRNDTDSGTGKRCSRKEQGRTVGQAQIQGVRVPVRFRLQLPVVEAAIATEMILKLMGIGVHRRERQPGEQPNRGGDLCLHDIAHVAVDMGVEIRTNRLMDVTHTERLVVREDGLILERRVEQKLPAVSTPSRCASPGRCQTTSWCSSRPRPQAANPVG